MFHTNLLRLWNPLPGHVYYVQFSEAEKTPHFFVLLASDDDNYYFVMLTSQLNSILKFREKFGVPEETIVYLDNNDLQCLTLPTYINCNKIKIVSKSDYDKLCSESSGNFFECNLPEPIYNKIILGISTSKMHSKYIQQICFEANYLT